jgi:hypothetical protein
MPVFARRPGFRPGGWQRFFGFIYACGCVLFLILGNFGFALCYAVLTFLFLLGSTDLDIFAPMSMVAQAFGIYFLVPLAFIKNRDPDTLLYISATLITAVVIYLLLPRLDFGIARRIDGQRAFRSSFGRTATLMECAGYTGFIGSTWMAGFHNPLMVFSDPIRYRFFMMVGGMTYVAEALQFLIMIPAVVLTVAYYERKASRLAFACSFGGAALYGLATGARGSVIMLLIQLLFIRHILHRKLGARLVLVFLLIVVPFVAISGEYRVLKYESQRNVMQSVIANISVADMAAMAFSRLDAAAMFNSFMIAERRKDPKLGMSYVEIIVDAVPRSVWNTKPRLPNPEMTRIVGQENPDLDIAFDFGIFGETFLNFAWLGVLVGGTIVAVVGSSMQCIYDDAVAKKSPIVIVFMAVMCTMPLALVVSGLVETIIAASFSIVKVLLVRKLFFRRATVPLTSPSPV